MEVSASVARSSRSATSSREESGQQWAKARGPQPRPLQEVILLCPLQGDWTPPSWSSSEPSTLPRSRRPEPYSRSWWSRRRRRRPLPLTSTSRESSRRPPTGRSTRGRRLRGLSRTGR
eukprot:16436028-Heterocapsa_arctica.AAC.1